MSSNPSNAGAARAGLEPLEPRRLLSANLPSGPATLPGAAAVQHQLQGQPQQQQSTVSVSHLRAADASIRAGSPVTLTADVSNTGSSDSPATPVTLYLSPGRQHQATDPVLGAVTLPAVPAGATVTFSVTLTVPATVRPASYFVSGLPLARGSLDTTLLPLFTVTAAPARSGGLNPGFGDNGVARGTLAGIDFTAADTVLQHDGKLLVAGSSTNAGFVLARFNADGSLDTSFGQGAGYVTADTGGADDHAKAVAIQADARILVAGTSDGDFAVLRFNPDGSLDPTFGNSGIVTTDLAPRAGAGHSTDEVRDVAYRGDGKIFVVGASDARGTNDFAVLRYNSDGSVDNTFATSGLALIDFGGHADAANTIAIQSDGNAVVAGSATTADGKVEFAVVRFNNVGAPDPHFGHNGQLVYSAGGTTEELLAVRTLPDSRLIVGGFTATGSPDTGDLRTSLYLARLTRSGAIDTTFGNHGQVVTPVPGDNLAAINDLVITPEGNIVAAAKTATSLDDAPAGHLGVSLTRYTPDGKLDTSFSTSGFLTLSQPGANGNNTGPLARSVPAAARSDDDSTETADEFDAFVTASTGLVAITSGGGVLTIATDSSDSGSADTTLSVVSVVSDSPDLTSAVADSSIPDSVLTGTTAKATLTLTNSGTAAVKATVPVTIYLSTSSLHADGDTAVLTTKLSVNLAAGKSKKFTLKFTFPKSLADGAYFVIADVNSAGVVSELDTTNDDSSSTDPTTVAAPYVDLSVAYAKTPPATATTGKSTTTTLTLTNLGNTTATGKTTIALLRSLDQTLDDTDPALLTSTPTLKLKARKSLTIVLKFTPTADDAGTDYLAATATFTGDTDPSNNTVFSDTQTTFA